MTRKIRIRSVCQMAGMRNSADSIFTHVYSYYYMCSQLLILNPLVATILLALFFSKTLGLTLWHISNFVLPVCQCLTLREKMIETSQEFFLSKKQEVQGPWCSS